MYTVELLAPTLLKFSDIFFFFLFSKTWRIIDQLEKESCVVLVFFQVTSFWETSACIIWF